MSTKLYVNYTYIVRLMPFEEKNIVTNMTNGWVLLFLLHVVDLDDYIFNTNQFHVLLFFFLLKESS